MCGGQGCTLSPTPLIASATAFYTGNSDTCMIVGGQVECLGDSSFGVIGTTTGPDTCSGGPNSCAQSPRTLFSSLFVGPSAISSRNTSACAIVSGGNVVCWGEDEVGEIGTNGTGSICSGNDLCSPTPVSVPGVTGATAITTGAFFTCALISDGTVDCWGDNEYGELGSSETALCANASYPCSISPLHVAGLSNVKQISAGDDFVCALRNDGTVMCWGDNGYDELGNASVTGACQAPFGVCSTTPVAVTGLSGATAIATGAYFGCALLSTGGVSCWGFNSFGQLGNGNTTSSLGAVSVQF